MAKEIIDSVEKLEEELARVREAQRKFSTYTQEQVDKFSSLPQRLQIWQEFRLLKWR